MQKQRSISIGLTLIGLFLRVNNNFTKNSNFRKRYTRRHDFQASSRCHAIYSRQISLEYNYLITTCVSIQIQIQNTIATPLTNPKEAGLKMETDQDKTPLPLQKRKELPTPKETRINPLNLKHHLSQELQDEERYKLVNDAKLRAMTQGTASYEDFRQIWMAAHLRPLEKDDRLQSGTKSKVVWNPISSSTQMSQNGCTPNK